DYLMNSYTEEEKVVVTKLVMELARIDNKKKRKDLVWWYSMASGINNNEKTKKIMEDIGVI
ncbi:hypothetical protein, partial [Niallia circulans]|uniref:hypothetical protein n=1 Tax=Niallia circulans TaxID=1397 RepID=UPI001C25408C